MITTHILDTTLGRPAAGVSVRLERRTERGWAEIGAATTDADGRIGQLGPEQSTGDDGDGNGDYRLTFDTGAYFGAQQRECFFPEVTVTFTVVDTSSHYHVPILLSPFSVSTYRGS